jgi:hypothetical protein
MATVDTSGRLTFAAGEKEQYQDRLKTELNLPADFVFGGGNFATYLANNPAQANLAQNVRQEFIDNPFGITPQTTPAPAPAAPPTAAPLTAQQIAAEIDIPEIDYSRISGLMAPTQTAAQGAQTAAQAAQTAAQSAQTGIGTATLGQPVTLFGGQAGLMTGQENILQGQTGLTAGQAGLATGQQQLGTGQQQLGTQVGEAATALAGGQQQLGAGQQQLGQQVGAVQTGVTGLGQTVGQAATDQAPATGLFAGQQGLMSGQQRMGTDISRQLGGVGANLTDFQRAVDAYQRGAEATRSQIQEAGVTGREQLQRQIGDVGVQANRAAEQLATTRQQLSATPRGASTVVAGGVPGGVQQQAAQFARTAPAPAAQAAPVGPLGPQAVDPRDALIQQLITNYQGLLSPQR